MLAEQRDNCLIWEIAMKIENTLEDLTCPFKSFSPPGTVKRKALVYLGKVVGEDLSKQDLRKVEYKAKKIKKSAVKSERLQNHQLMKQIDLITD